MTKFFNKLLLSATTTLLLANIANAQTTICYKNNLDKPSAIESALLEGGECNGQFNINEMKAKGWNVVDIKVESKKDLLNYTYILSDKKVNKNAQVVKSTEDTVATASSNSFSIKPIGMKIEDIKDNKTTVSVGNLIVGQSGIVVHVYDNTKRMIVSNAKVIETNANESTIEFFPFDDLKQDAIPTAKRTVEVNDILVLNYMYPASLLIAPTQDTFQIVRSNFKYNNFLHSDIFATKLKIDNEPYPTKEIIQKFAIEQNLGTVFIVVDNKVNIVDTKTFKILTSYPINYSDENTTMPFYTRVEKIEESPLSMSFTLFGDSDSKSNYEKYYKKVLGLN
jgi:hypothetical protein